jgi:hypothetical protein
MKMYVHKRYKHRCPNCGWRSEQDVTYDPYTGDSYCDICDGSEIAESREIEPEFISVAAYTTDRCYGGPEEGGWWYDEGYRCDETLRCFAIGDLPQAELYCERLWDQGYSVVRAYGDRLAVKKWPEIRPVYC